MQRRKLPLQEIIEHVKRAKFTRKEQEKSTSKPKKVGHFLPSRLLGHAIHTMFRVIRHTLCVKHEAKISHLILSRQMMDSNKHYKLKTVNVPGKQCRFSSIPLD